MRCGYAASNKALKLTRPGFASASQLSAVFALFSRGDAELMPGLSFQPRRAEGPVGTGVHLLRTTPHDSGVLLADAWLTILFLPVVPLGEWIVERYNAADASSVISQVRPPQLVKSVLWVGGGVLAALLSLVPAYGALTFLRGSKVAELTGMFATVGAVLGPLAWLDETRDRVPMLVAVRALAVALRWRGNETRRIHHEVEQEDEADEA